MTSDLGAVKFTTHVKLGAINSKILANEDPRLDVPGMWTPPVIRDQLAGQSPLKWEEKSCTISCILGIYCGGFMAGKYLFKDQL